MAVENTNYNFRRANFDAMRADHDDERLERLIVNSDAAQGFELLKNKILESCRRHIPKKHITINNPSWMNNDVKQSIARRQRAYDEKKRNNTDETSAEYLTARRLVKRAGSKPNATRKSMLQDYAKLTLKDSTPTSMREE